MTIVKLFQDGQIMIPLTIRERYHLEEGDDLIVRNEEDGLHLIPLFKLSKSAGIFKEKGLIIEFEKLRREERSMQ